MTDYTYKPSWVGDFLATLFFVALAVNVARFFSTTVGVLALVVAAIALPMWGYRLAGREVNLTADGSEFVGVFRTTRFRWRDAYYRYEPIHESSTGNGIIADATASRRSGASYCGGVVTFARRSVCALARVAPSNSMSRMPRVSKPKSSPKLNARVTVRPSPSASMLRASDTAIAFSDFPSSRELRCRIRSMFIVPAH